MFCKHHAFMKYLEVPKKYKVTKYKKKYFKKYQK